MSSITPAPKGKRRPKVAAEVAGAPAMPLQERVPASATGVGTRMNGMAMVATRMATIASRRALAPRLMSPLCILNQCVSKLPPLTN